MIERCRMMIYARKIGVGRDEEGDPKARSGPTHRKWPFRGPLPTHDGAHELQYYLPLASGRWKNLPSAVLSAQHAGCDAQHGWLPTVRSHVRHAQFIVGRSISTSLADSRAALRDSKDQNESLPRIRVIFETHSSETLRGSE